MHLQAVGLKRLKVLKTGVGVLQQWHDVWSLFGINRFHSDSKLMAKSYAASYIEIYRTDVEVGEGFLVRSRKSGTLFQARKYDLRALDQHQRKQLSKDLAFLRELRHPNILRLEQTFTESDQLVVVTQLCEEGSLKQLIQQRRAKKGQFGESLLLNWLLQILLALDHLHSRGVVHRDLRPANIHLTRTGNIKIGHFQTARALGPGELAQTMVGLPSYMSPQILQSLPYSNKHDMWSLGCLLFQLCSLRPAFKARSIQQLFDKVIRAEQSIELPKCYSKFIQGITRRCLRKDPLQRPSCRDLVRLPPIIKVMQEYIMKGGCLRQFSQQKGAKLQIDMQKGRLSRQREKEKEKQSEKRLSSDKPKSKKPIKYSPFNRSTDKRVDKLERAKLPLLPSPKTQKKVQGSSPTQVKKSNSQYKPRQSLQKGSKVASSRNSIETSGRIKKDSEPVPAPAPPPVMAPPPLKRTEGGRRLQTQLQVKEDFDDQFSEQQRRQGGKVRAESELNEVIGLYRQQLAESLQVWQNKYSPEMEVILEMTNEFSSNDFERLTLSALGNEFLTQG